MGYLVKDIGEGVWEVGKMMKSIGKGVWELMKSIGEGVWEVGEMHMMKCIGEAVRKVWQ